MTNKSKARHGIRGSYRFKLNPTTRAIRNAFALGLALAAGSQQALAGTCTNTTPTDYTCDGAFGGSIISNIDDLSLVVGGNLPTVIFGSPGFAGIDLYSANGGITLVTDADIFGAAGYAGISVSAYGDATVTNTGNVSAFYADGIDAASFGLDGNTSVTNSGNVSAISAFGYGESVTGINAASKYGDAYVNNTEGSSVSAVSLYGYDAVATGINAFSKYGYASVNNDGGVEASSIQGNAYGITAQGYTGAAITNGATGSVSAETASNYHLAAGITAYTYNGNATVSNSGDITATNTGTGDYSYGSAYGAAAGSYNGNAYANNDGSISASTSTKYGRAVGIGAASYNGNAYTTNNDGGTVSAYTSGKYGVAIGAYAHSYNGDASVTNNDGGSIDATATGKYGVAVGAVAIANYGDATVTNNYGGSIDATATGKYGTAIGVQALGDTAHVSNGGSIHADASYSGENFADVTAIGGIAIGVQARIDNDEGGSISANAYAYYGYATAIGSYVYAEFDGTTDNHGDISATAYAVTGGSAGTILPSVDVTAIGSMTVAGNANLYNYGNIDANASVGTGTAYAVGSLVLGGYAFTGNNATITAEAYAFDGVATAVGSSTYGKYATEYNGVNATTSAYADVTFGAAVATGTYTSGKYTADTNNFGSISAEANVFEGAAYAYGAITVAGDFATLTNYSSGSISASAYAYAGYALAVGSLTQGTAALTTNYGSISADASVEFGTAIAFGAANVGDFAVLDNYGSVSASAYAYSGYAIATGAYSYGGFDATVVNEEGGSISADATVYYGLASATGAFAYGTYAAIYNDGDISADAHAYGDYSAAVAVGARTFGYFGASVDNTGNISATATADGYGSAAFAEGIFNYAFAFGGYVSNSGDVSATATADGGDSSATAAGIVNIGYFYGPTTTTNDGTVEATANADGGKATAIGIYGYSFFYSSSIYNNGDISATATADFGAAYAIGAESVGPSKYGEALVVNYGDITATANAYAGLAVAYGSVSNGKYYGGTYNFDGGNISAVANADFGAAYAFGAVTYGKYEGVLYNAGDITAEANAYGGFAFAVGSNTSAKYLAETFNDGSISAVATADYGAAIAYGSVTSSTGYVDYYGVTHYGFAGLVNDGSISATANAYGGVAEAFGAFVSGGAGYYENGYIGAEVLNSGSISATATGYDAIAVGLVIEAVYGTYTYNTGSITATANGVDGAAAIAVDMSSYGLNLLVNEGTITANGNGLRIAVSSSDYAVAAIINDGTITGSIQTGNYGDLLDNEGTWNALQDSYFGGGDDYIVNNGTINMPGSTIDLGGYAKYGNTFNNYGTINVRGHSLIDMGGNESDEGFYSNPNPFYQGGVISWLDGAPDDLLTVVGDFAGHGDLVMDFNGTTSVADHLYIEGDIIEPTVQTVSGVLRAPPVLPYSEINFAWVFGTSKPGDFVLGTISNPTDLFYTLNYGIVSHINVASSTTDVYALGVTVSGLSPRGVMAASIAPGIQNLWHDGIGTVFQREGTVRDQDETGPALWVRMFTTNGTVDAVADHRNFGSGGSQRFDQKNQGAEFGFAFHFNPEWSAGLVLGKSDADISPDTGGRGKIKAGTYGAYLTFLPGNGFYGDLSYRRMDFDTDAIVAGGNFSAQNGSADGWSLEMGYSFDTASGWKVEPQVQFSEMKIDHLDNHGEVINSSWGKFVLTDGDSARSRLGVSLRKTYTHSEDHSWTPYVALSAVHEDKGDNRFSIANNFTGGSDLRGNSGLFEAGATAQSGAWTLFGGMTYRDGAAFNGVFGGQIGVRYDFGNKPAPPPAPMVAPPPPPQKTCADMDDDGDGVNNCNDKCPDSVAGQAIGPDGCPVPLTIDLKGVNFDFDKSTLRPDAVAILDEAVSILTKYPELKVEVAGHTDSVGTEQYNQGLSERRAKAVYDYLTGHGVDAGRLAGPNGYGESKPIDTNDTKEGRARNRRTELDVQN